MPDIPGKSDPTDGLETRVEENWNLLVARLVRLYPYHLAGFIGLNVALTAVNVYTGKPWWALWPLVVTGFVFLVHYLIYKASTVNESWVDERAADLYDKSYDQGHIRAIAGHHEMETAADRRAAAARAAIVQEAKRRRLSGPADGSDK